MKLALVLFLATAGTLRVHSVPIDNESSSSLLSSGLEKDLKDFLALVPVQEIQEIVLEYLSNDADFQETLEYLVSKEFTSLVLEIEAMQDVKVFLKYLHDSGLDVYNLLNQLHDFLGLEHYVPITQQIERKITGGLPGLIKDIEAILPLEKIEALYQEKLKSSKEFADLIKHIKSSEFQNTVNTVFKNPKVQDLINKAKAKGVDVKAILDLVTKILGIKFPGLTRFTNLGMQQDIDDFLALIPKQKIQDLVLEYLATDHDFQVTMDYILSNEFRSLVLDIEAIPEVRMFIQYLNNVGLDVYNGLKILHDFLGIDHYVPFSHNYGLLRITGGLPGLIEDIKAILPIHDIQELYEEKLKTSQAFRSLVEQLKSEKSQKIIDIVWANEKFIKLINRAEAKGVDVKAILQLLTDILGIKFPSSRHTRSITMGLNDDLQEFLSLVPKKEIEELVMEYLASDADFQETLEYLLSNDFKNLVLEIEAIKDVKLFIKYLSDAGLDVYTLLNQLHDFLGLDHITPMEFDDSYETLYQVYKITGGLKGLIEDVKAILPLDKIQELYKKKLDTSSEFAALIKKLGSPDFQKIVDLVWTNPKLQELINKAQAKGVDVKAILKLITEILGIKFPSSRAITMGLNDDLKEFLALVPQKEIEALVMEYLTSDADFQEAVEYMLSNDFKNLVLEIEAIKDVKLFIKYLSDAGLDVYTLLNQLHDFLGLDHITPFEFSELDYVSFRITGGLPGLIEDVKAILPLDKVEALYKKKLETSPEFAALIKKISSPEFQKIVDTVWANPRLQELINKAQDKGVDVKAILKLITEILGIHFPSSRSITMGLNDDLKEFLALVPQKEIEALVMEYLSSDADFQEVLEYVLSNDFKNLVLEIEAIKDVKLFIKYLNDVGLDVYTLLNQFHDFLGLDHITPSIVVYGAYKITGGLPGLIEDVKALLPVDKIEALYKKKLETSPEFAALIKKISSTEFQKIVDTVWANPRLQELINKAQAKGVDVKAILKLITEILGIHFPSSRSVTMGLNDDLKEFLALVPQKEIEALVMEYLTSDADFQEVLEYVLSNDFKNLVLEIEAIKDVKLFIKYLNDAGLDVYTLLNQLHDFLGLDHMTPFEFEDLEYITFRITGGLPGLIEDVKALLPVDKIEALYKKKLATSAEFAALIKKISSPEFQKIVDTVWANPRLQELVNKAQAKGVDVKAILKLITEILGIKFPSSRAITMGLNDDLKEFLALVPQKEIEALVMEYLTADADFQEAVEYMLSNDFKNLVLEIEAIKDVKLFIKYLSDAGLDVYTLLNQLHDFLGLDHMTPFEFEDSEYITFRITGGLPGLIEDVKAILPLDKIQTLYKKKLETSTEFAALIKKISSPEFQKIINTVWANPKLQELINKAQSKGVDVKAILQLITEILGIHFPGTQYKSPMFIRSCSGVRGC
ncbi:uncharacterized protein LOC127284686 isoform X2 [Leptopilina boulardi]|uniref:uncharacterized protein LOC127284686 isoform X2 n=1 Tax=Leptopilina boulardi TaxID=63433 RepID=UPI0021F51A4F|nr:uncharacterized protein LOC127284686 isoform X2 [Leptopilina boulardi]